jgi:hypothetical protein
VCLRTEYEFVLPRGFVDRPGAVHRTGTMRLATARDELEPLRDPTVSGPDDPRLTVLVLARVVTRLGSLELVTPHEIEGLFAADLAFLQDFYGVINFGTQEEYEALLQAQQDLPAPPSPVAPAPVPAPSATDVPAPAPAGDAVAAAADRPRRAAIEEISAGGR